MKQTMHMLMSSLILIALLSSACGPLTPEPTPTASEPTATLPPTEEPPPTVTPMPLPAPRLRSHRPAPGQEQSLDAPVQLTFDQPMDRASVEAAFAISPTVEGTFSWSEERSVAFVPADDLERGTAYHVIVKDTARNLEGTTLAEPVTFDFATLGYLTVSQVTPGPASEEVDPNTVATVVFGRPVVPVTAIGRQAELPQPLTFVPPVRGQGEWLNSSVYLFRPEDGFLPATRYKGRVAAGLTDTTGAVLAQDYVWEFSTVRPAVLELSPAKGFQYVAPTDVISITFNQPMDHSSVQATFSLQAANQPVTGTFRWRGGRKAVDPETMLFVPDQPLSRDTRFTAKLDAGAGARAGNVGTADDVTWRFSTVKAPGVVRTFPRDGDADVDPTGSLRIEFASPMQREGFLEHLSVRPEVTRVYTYWSEYDTQVEVYFPREPVTAYTVVLDAQTPDKHGSALGTSATIDFTTGDLAPFAVLNTTGQIGAFSAYTDTVAYATYRNVSQLDGDLYRLDVATFTRLASDWETWDRFAPSERNLVRHWSQTVAGARNKVGVARLDLVDDESQPLAPGLYYLEVSAPEVREAAEEYRPSRYMFVKSRLNLTLKQARSEALVWATDLASGQPVASLPVILRNKSSQIGTPGTSDRQGLFQEQALAVGDLWTPLFAVTGKPGDETFGIAYNGWDLGISPWDFGLESEFWASSFQAYVYTDRPIYRPGQTVHFKGILRADDDANYTLPTPIKTVQVRITDPQGKELYNENLRVNEMGTLNDELVLVDQAALGGYYVEIQAPEQEFYAGTSFQVAEYRKPEFEVSVRTDRDAYLSGDTINVSAEASYYFGGPVADANVRWSVLSSNYQFSFACPAGRICPRYSWSDYEWGSYDRQPYYDGFGRLIAEGDAKTDDQGRVTFRVPADISQQAQSQIFTIEASVTDVNAQQVSNRTAAIVHQGEFYVGVAPRGYLAQVGRAQQVDLVTVDWESQPVSGVPLTVVFMEHNWYSVRRQAEDGNYYWDWTAEDVPVLTTTVTTNDDGQAVTTFSPPSAGSYKVRAVGRDAGENEIRSAAYFWVSGGDEYVSWRQESNNRIELIADKDEYQVGDVAEILVPSPYTGTVQALVTIERGHVMDTEVRELESNSEVLRIPITEAQVPNVFVSVVIIEGSEQAADGLATFKMGVVKLPLSLETRELTIALTPDKEMATGEHYRPRQTANFDVLVTDHKAQPVEAELSLRLADLAVLALADEPGPTMMESFWRDRGLGVRTGMPLVVSMERFNRELRPAAKGGGGGDEGLVRSRFADTAFWDPVVRTNKEGRAQVSVQLPDNLTTWRMQARGISADTLVGEANVDVLSSLDLMVRPTLPRFFVVGDKAEIAAIVHNNSTQTLEVEVNISADGLAMDDSPSQTVTVPAQEKASVRWPVEVLPSDQVRVRMWASAGELYDGREDILPVYPYTTPEVVATAGLLPEPALRQEVFQLPSTFDPTQGGLTVQIDGSLTAATQDALTYLEHYPYECVEQTVSRFLPNVVTWEVLQELGIERPELEQKLPQMVGVGLQRLYAQQHYDGGWGWWVSDKSDPYLTAYILHGMLEAQRAAFTVDQESMARAAGFLGDNLPSVGRLDTHWEANRLAYLLYVLADYHTANDEPTRGELGLAIRLFDKRHLLGQYGQATLAVALSLLEPEEPSRTRTLLSNLAGSAIVSATGTHWEEDEPDYWNMNTNIRTTAIILWALARLEPKSQLLPSTARWLMAVRQQGYWETTQGTAWSLLALGEYMRASGELEGDFGYAVYLNGADLARGDISRQNVAVSHKIEVDIARLLVDEANRLVIQRHTPQAGQTGKGMLYYSAHLEYHLPAEQVRASSRGISVARQYSPLYEPSESVDTAQVGDVVKVKLTIIAPTDLYYVVVEDPLPAGFEAVDQSLKTTSVVGEAPELRNLTLEEQDRWYRQYGYGWWWFSHSEMRDEKVGLFAQYLPRGTYEYTYLMRASLPGEFRVKPTTAYEMYFPEVSGRGDGGKFLVNPGD